MIEATRRLVAERAGHRCEYCLIRVEHVEVPHHIEHIVARQHGGEDDPANLALSCAHCNLHKGPNIAGIDQASGAIVPLFNPRSGRWEEHFGLIGPMIAGRTATGRATAHVLAMNAPRRLAVRRELIAMKLFP